MDLSRVKGCWCPSGGKGIKACVYPASVLVMGVVLQIRVPFRVRFRRVPYYTGDPKSMGVTVRFDTVGIACGFLR